MKKTAPSDAGQGKRTTKADETLVAGNEELRKEIADRKKIEERLLKSEAALHRALDEIKKSEAKLRRVIDTIPTLAWCNLPDGPNEFLNKGWHEYTGLSPEESQGWGWTVAFYPDDLPPLMEKWQKMLMSGESDEIEARLRRHDGVYRWFLIRAQAFRDESGKIIRWYGTSTDIEDKKRAEQALVASERNLRLIINTVPTLAWSAQPDGGVEFVNQRWLDYTGLSPVQAQRWGWAQAIHPDDLGYLSEYWLATIAAGQPGEIEARLRRFDGNYRWFLFRASPLRNESGEIVKWYGTNTDIEDRKQAEAALQASERSLAAIINTIPTTAWTARTDGYCDFLNQVWLDYVGMTAEKAQGWGWAEAIHPDDRNKLVEEWQSCLASGKPVDTEARIRRFDGIYRWFLIRANPLKDELGKILKWYGTCTDIDDRKKAEEALQASELDARSLLDNMPGFLVRISPDGTLEFVNRPFLQYFGKTLDDAKEWRTNDIVHPDDLARVIEVFGNGISTGQAFDFEYRPRRFDGVYRWFRARWVPVRNLEGRILHWNGLVTDIDDRKKAEEALLAGQRHLSLMIDTIPALIHTARPDGYLDYFNQPWLEYLGCSLSDIEGWKWTSWIHPDDLKGIVDEWEACLASGKILQYETRVRRPNGKYRWMFHRKVPLHDEQGNIVRWYGTSLDIEDQKQAQAEVEQAYLRLAEAQQLSKTGSFIADLLADDHNWSEEAYRIFEFDPSAKVTMQKVRNIIHPEDLPAFDAVTARAMTGTDVDLVFRIMTPRGAVKHIRGIARFMQQTEGRSLLFIGAFQDVTESKIAEDALNKARSELAQVARVTTLNALTASIAHEINQPLSGIITNASTCLRMLDGHPPNLDGARETMRRTLRDGNRASDVISRLRALYSKKEFTLESVDLNDATLEVIALSLSDLQRNRIILRSELADGLPPVTGDRVQLQQVVLNLIRNASDAMGAVNDRPRELVIRTERDEGDKVRLTVKDRGVGFATEATDKLFEAFYTTKADGMGIGLSISRSIIEAHHGRLWAAANDGPGTTFSFVIPCKSGDLAEIEARNDAA